jgi:hypothetical protein
VAVYVTQTDLEKRAGAQAVSLRLDDDPAAVTEAIADGCAEVDFYLAPRYDPAAAAFAANSWVRRAAVVACLVTLCERRLNSVPKALAAEWERWQAKLELIRTGAAIVPGLAQRKGDVPVLSQPRVRLWPYPRTLTERGRSTGHPAGYPLRDDNLEPPNFT